MRVRQESPKPVDSTVRVSFQSAPNQQRTILLDMPVSENDSIALHPIYEQSNCTAPALKGVSQNRIIEKLFVFRIS